MAARGRGRAGRTRPGGAFGLVFTVILLGGAVWLLTQTPIGADIAEQLRQAAVQGARGLLDALTSWAR